MTASPHAQHRNLRIVTAKPPTPRRRATILVLDIEGYTEPSRTNTIRVELRTLLRALLAKALDEADLGGVASVFDITGDGCLVLMDDDAVSAVLCLVVPRLLRQLIDYQVELPTSESSRRRLRLRAVVHVGGCLMDSTPVGEAVNDAFGLLGAQMLRDCLRATPLPLVVGISNQVYEDVVRQGEAGDADRFELIAGKAKDWRAGLWIWVPGDVNAVSRAAAARRKSSRIPGFLIPPRSASRA